MPETALQTARSVQKEGHRSRGSPQPRYSPWWGWLPLQPGSSVLEQRSTSSQGQATTTDQAHASKSLTTRQTEILASSPEPMNFESLSSHLERIVRPGPLLLDNDADRFIHTFQFAYWDLPSCKWKRNTDILWFSSYRVIKGRMALA